MKYEMPTCEIVSLECCLNASGETKQVNVFDLPVVDWAPEF
jgi:hypothetical protein